MTRNSRLLLLLAGLVLLGLSVWGLYQNIEFYEDTEHSSWSSKALHNPYLAAQQFMERSGIEVIDVDSLARLDRIDDLSTLLFSDDNQIRTPRQLNQLIEWLEAGGNVIYSASSVEHDDDLLLQKFSVEVDFPEDESKEEIDAQSVGDSLREYNRQIEAGKSREEIVASLGKPESSNTKVSFSDEIGDLEIAFDTDRVLMHSTFEDGDAEVEYEPFSWSNSEHGVHMMQFEVGEGLLTLVSDPAIWTSYEIDTQDHAYLLWLLSSQESGFAILRSVFRESLWTLTKKNAPELLLAMGLLIAITMWRLGGRFGRLLPRDLSRRRALGEHFSSLSHYLWKRRRGKYLITPLRQAVLRRASLTLGGFNQADQPRQFELIAERCDLQPASIARAFGDNDFNETSFVVTVRLLKHIEQSL